MVKSIGKEIKKVIKSPYLDTAIVKHFQQRFKKENLIRDENPEDHFCVMVAPFDIKMHKIFLGHHKKADDWIPPGGHIEKGESPTEAAVREAHEELCITISQNQLKLFTLDYLDVTAPNRICKMHWHIWYIFKTQEEEYRFDRHEFHDAGWFTIDNAVNKVKIPEYRKIYEQMKFL
jgi:8-oxo-dGTP pyrophosphatase MutT (NUDIX family)